MADVAYTIIQLGKLLLEEGKLISRYPRGFFRIKFSFLDEKEQAMPLNELKTMLEKGSENEKIAAMKLIISQVLNGDPMTSIFMFIIRFIMPTKNKSLKKLLLLYWEVCPKVDQNGKLRQEMIMVCNALRNDLQHPNEYVRGITLRFLCKLKEPEILEPCIPSVRACLDHRHAFVRKNAVLAILFIHKNCEILLPDAPELIRNYISTELDSNAKRNALITLINTNTALAVEYLSSVWTQIPTFDAPLQLSVLELIRKDCRNPSADKGKYIQCTFNLLQSSSNSVRYEAANTLVTLTSHSNAVKAVASAYIELIVKEADHNVKLIILERFRKLHEKHDRVFDDQVMDVLRILSSSDLEIRKKCLTIVLEMVSSRNIDEVVGYLKKELLKTQSAEFDKSTEYTQVLIQAIHHCAIQFSEVAASVISVLMEFIGDVNSSDVVSFIREVIEKFPHLRVEILEHLLSTFPNIKSSRVFRGALWVLGEYTLEIDTMKKAMSQIRQVIGELPILSSQLKMHEDSVPESEGTTPRSSVARVLADGTYATESAFSSAITPKTKSTHSETSLRALILAGDYYVGTVLASSLTKIVSRYAIKTNDIASVNMLKAEAMLIMTSIIRVGNSDIVTLSIDEDSNDRLLCCLRILSALGTEQKIQDVFLKETRKAFTNLLETDILKKDVPKNKKTVSKVQVDDMIQFRLFKNKKVLESAADYNEIDVVMATGAHQQVEKLKSKLSQVIQLTGFSDPVYAEAYVNINQYDILLDVLIINQTQHTLQNLSLEFSTLGDLKLVERPVPQTVGPRGFHTVKANLKVSSTETGAIFGNIVFDAPQGLDSSFVILNEIHIDIMEYIKPAMITENAFRSMWTEFEWENKVNVNTNIIDLREYLDHLLKSTNMACLTNLGTKEQDCGFLAANLYAKSIFGEDALANISLEQTVLGEPITGHVRIRAKTQGIALSLGDKITLSQKKI